MGRDVSCVETHGQLDAFVEEVYGNGGHADKGRAVLHALGVLLRPEDGDARVIGRAEGFQAFVALHSVVEAGRHPVEAQEGVAHEFGRCPLPGGDGVVRFDVPVYFLERERVSK